MGLEVLGAGLRATKLRDFGAEAEHNTAAVYCGHEYVHVYEHEEGCAEASLSEPDALSRNHGETTWQRLKCWERDWSTGIPRRM